MKLLKIQPHFLFAFMLFIFQIILFFGGYKISGITSKIYLWKGITLDQLIIIIVLLLPLAYIYFGIQGMRHKNDAGGSSLGSSLVIVVGVFVLLASLFFIGLMAGVSQL